MQASKRVKHRRKGRKEERSLPFALRALTSRIFVRKCGKKPPFSRAVSSLEMFKGRGGRERLTRGNAFWFVLMEREKRGGGRSVLEGERMRVLQEGEKIL